MRRARLLGGFLFASLLAATPAFGADDGSRSPTGSNFSNNPCISEAITGLLVDGTVPEDGTECAGPLVDAATASAASA